MINITIDNKQLQVEEGNTVLEAAFGAGIYIPQSVLSSRLTPSRGLRLCLVEIDGMRGLPPSCTTYVSDGMVVRTNTPSASGVSEEYYLATSKVTHPKDLAESTQFQKVGPMGGRQRRPSRTHFSAQETAGNPEG